MSTVGQLVRETIDLTDRGLHQQAFYPAVQAIKATLEKASNGAVFSDQDLKNFLNDSWQIISMIGMPQSPQLPPDLSSLMRQNAQFFVVERSIAETVFYIIRQTILIGGLPLEFAVNTNPNFEFKVGKLFLPVGLVNGLLGSVIFHPANSDEQIEDKYWFNFAGFKMFISEFWGRRDLAERIIKFHLE
jgi:hypothetical protein